MLAWVLLVGALLHASGPLEAHVLNVPYRSQLDGSAYAMSNCGPTSLSMVLAYYGIDAPIWDLRVAAMQAQHSWVDDEGGYSDDYGVFVYNLASVAEVMGLRTTGLWTREGVRVDRLREWQASDFTRRDPGRSSGDRRGGVSGHAEPRSIERGRRSLHRRARHCWK
jgi:Peptidase_C39 like family